MAVCGRLTRSRRPPLPGGLQVPPPGVRENVRVLGIKGKTSARIVRKDVPVCGGGFVHIVDDVVTPCVPRRVRGA